MSIKHRLNYYRRIFPAYFGQATSQLSFWHETPEVNEHSRITDLQGYYMRFRKKADYQGCYDASGIPLLNYHGKLGLQYNPIAIAQYGLANYNLFLHTKDEDRQRKWLTAANWLVTTLEQNDAGLWVWNHHFDWEYRTRLIAPWYSALAQGQGISMLVRANRETGNEAYLSAAHRAFATFLNSIDEGGVVYVDETGHIWFEEYIVFPPTHILNGFIWASWGLYDYFLATGDRRAKALFDEAVRTLISNLHRYDTGYWSLYEQSGTTLKMFASPFYHRLHIVQLKILFLMTGEDVFERYARHWQSCLRSRSKRTAALANKILFKLCYY